MRLRTLSDLDVDGRRVLLRTDYNIETHGEHVDDDLRLRASLPTIEELRGRGARVIICSHRGRARGKRTPELRNGLIASDLERLLGTRLLAVDDCAGPRAQAAAAVLEAGAVMLLDNIRFEPGEEANDPAFARRLAGLAESFVNDAFGTLHRAHASTVGVTAYLPSAAGRLVERELARLSEVVEAPEHPLVLVVGGVKVPDKLPLLRHFLDHADTICLGGFIALAFLEARGDVPEPARVCDEATIRAAQALLAEIDARAVELLLPVDAVIAPSADAPERARTIAVTELTPGWAFLDIGPDTIGAFEAALAGAGTAIWNGPLGRFEAPPFDRGTVAVAKALARLDAMTVVGGGETVAAVRRHGPADRMWHVSTGGGAALAFLGGKSLPGYSPFTNARSPRGLRAPTADDPPRTEARRHAMTLRVGINGFGRIGRQTVRAWYAQHRDDIDVVAVNELEPTDLQAHLLR